MRIEDFIRPSAMEPIELCPGRPTMEARAIALMPFLSQMESEPARQGTMGHNVIAGVISDCCAGNWKNANEVLVGLESRMQGLAYWCKDAVRTCINYAFDLVRRYIPKYDTIEVFSELHLDGTGIHIERGGTADLVVLCYNKYGYQLELDLVVIADWKTGFVSQGEAADHLQLACYAVMAADEFAPKSAIIPHLVMGRRKEHSSALYQQNAIEGARRRIIRAINAAQSSEPELRPCLKACRYCKAITLCRHLRNYLMHAQEELAMFGIDPENRLAMVEAAKLAKRFSQEVETVSAMLRDQCIETQSTTPVTTP